MTTVLNRKAPKRLIDPSYRFERSDVRWLAHILSPVRSGLKGCLLAVVMAIDQCLSMDRTLVELFFCAR
jgi:hypothetical protein